MESSLIARVQTMIMAAVATLSHSKARITPSDLDFIQEILRGTLDSSVSSLRASIHEAYRAKEKKELSTEKDSS